MLKTIAPLATLLTVVLLLSPRFSRQGSAPCNASPQTLANCRDQAGSDHRTPDCIEDERLKEALLEGAVTLLERGQTVDAKSLMKHLNSDLCVLEVSEGSGIDREPADLYADARRSVVVIGGLYRCDHCSQWHVSIASGFVIHPAGAIVTNFHVVEAPETVAFVVMTAEQQVYPVQRILAASREDDVAILQVPANGLPPLPLAGSTVPAAVGSAVSVISHPDGHFYSYTAGIISRHMKVRGQGRSVDALAITADYARGSSGAPVLSCQGTVIAIVSSTESIYYTQDGARQRNLQMVFKTCIPVTSLWRLIDPPPQVTGTNLPRQSLVQADVE